MAVDGNSFLQALDRVRSLGKASPFIILQYLTYEDRFSLYFVLILSGNSWEFPWPRAASLSLAAARRNGSLLNFTPCRKTTQHLHRRHRRLSL